jgi:branched-chain amino acid transport system permease protein
VDAKIMGGVLGMVIPFLFDDLTCYYVLLALCIGSLFLSYKLPSTKWGLAFMAIREDQTAAAQQGINVLKYKTLAWVLSNLIIASVGFVATLRRAYIMPSDIFSIFTSLYLVIVVLIGGAGTAIGPLLGGLICELASYLVFIRVGFALLLIYGIIMVVVKLLLPMGVYPYLNRVIARISIKHKKLREKDK